MATAAARITGLDAVGADKRRGGDVRVLLSPKTVGSTSGFMGVATIAPGDRITEHYHPYSEEFLYVIEGSLEMTVDGNVITLSPGDSLWIPINAKHRLASRATIEIDDLRQERWLRRCYCEQAEQVDSLIRSHNLDPGYGHELTSERDLITLLEADWGVAFAPRSVSRAETLKHAAVSGIEFRRTIYLYGVAGRQRTAVASAMLKMLRARDWSMYGDG